MKLEQVKENLHNWVTSSKNTPALPTLQKKVAHAIPQTILYLWVVQNYFRFLKRMPNLVDLHTQLNWHPMKYSKVLLHNRLHEQKFIILNIHQNLHFMQSMETKLIKFCTHCRTLRRISLIAFSTVHNLKKGNADFSSALNDIHGPLSAVLSLYYNVWLRDSTDRGASLADRSIGSKCLNCKAHTLGSIVPGLKNFSKNLLDMMTLALHN